MTISEFNTFCDLVIMFMDTRDVTSVAHAQSLALGVILDERARAAGLVKIH